MNNVYDDTYSSSCGGGLSSRAAYEAQLRAQTFQEGHQKRSAADILDEILCELVCLSDSINTNEWDKKIEVIEFCKKIESEINEFKEKIKTRNTSEPQ